MKRLVLRNNNARKIGTFRDDLSDFSTGTPDNQAFDQALGQESTLPLTTTKLKNSGKNKAKGQTLITKHLSIENKSTTQIPKSPSSCKAPTPPPIAMKLIRPIKQKIKVLATTMESILFKQMQQVVNNS